MFRLCRACCVFAFIFLPPPSASRHQVLVDVMRKRAVQAGECVIKQGDKGDIFYIIDKGTFEVRVNLDSAAVVTGERDAGETRQSRRSSSHHPLFRCSCFPSCWFLLLQLLALLMDALIGLFVLLLSLLLLCCCCFRYC